MISPVEVLVNLVSADSVHVAVEPPLEPGPDPPESGVELLHSSSQVGHVTGPVGCRALNNRCESDCEY